MSKKVAQNDHSSRQVPKNNKKDNTQKDDIDSIFATATKPTKERNEEGTATGSNTSLKKVKTDNKIEGETEKLKSKKPDKKKKEKTLDIESVKEKGSEEESIVHFDETTNPDSFQSATKMDRKRMRESELEFLGKSSKSASKTLFNFAIYLFAVIFF